MGKVNQLPKILLHLLIPIGLCAASPCFGALGTIHLKGGKLVTAEIVAADRGQVLWKTDSKPNTEVRTFFRDQIEYVDFPSTDSWGQAEIAFESGKIDEAIVLYTQVIANRDFNYYPMLGNFASLAQVRLLECYRIKMNRSAIVLQAEKVRKEFSNLPPELRKFDPVTKAWIAISKKEWEAVITAIKVEDPPSSEGFLLRGMALESLGKQEEAVQAYAGAYVLNFGGPVNIAKQALQRSSAILAKIADKDRKNEIQAQAKIYRDLFGKGKLWEGAPGWLVKLADGKIVTLGKADLTSKAKSKPGGKSIVVSEKLEVAALPAPEKRDWVLVSELPHKIFLKGTTPNKDNFKNAGGVTTKDGIYLFDGTGGGIQLSGIDANQDALLLRLVFITDSTDGAIFDLNNVEGKEGGLGVYLEKGNLNIVWAKAGSPAKTWSAGKVKPGQKYQFFLAVEKSKQLSYLLGNAKEPKSGKPLGPLGIGTGLSASIGDTRAGTWDRETADRKEHTPFKGKILHLSIGTGKTAKQILDKETAQFGGKKVRLNPPE